MHNLYHLITFAADHFERLAKLPYKNGVLADYRISFAATLRLIHNFYIQRYKGDSEWVPLSSANQIFLCGSATTYKALKDQIFPHLFEIDHKYSTFGHRSKRYKLKWSTQWTLSKRKYIYPEPKSAENSFELDFKPALTKFLDAIPESQHDLPENLIARNALANFRDDCGQFLPQMAYNFITAKNEPARAVRVLDLPYCCLIDFIKDPKEREGYLKVLGVGNLIDLLLFMNIANTAEEAKSQLHNFMTTHRSKKKIEDLFAGSFPKLTKELKRTSNTSPNRILNRLKRLEKSILNKVEELAEFPLMRIDKGFLCAQSKSDDLKEILEVVVKEELGLSGIIKIN